MNSRPAWATVGRTGSQHHSKMTHDFKQATPKTDIHNHLVSPINFFKIALSLLWEIELRTVIHSRQKLHCMPIPLSTGLILRQGLDVVENYSRAQASLELPDSVFPVASIICTWHEGDREGLGKWFLPCQGEDLSLNPQMQGMGIEPCIFNPRSLVVRWEVEPGESQEARYMQCPQTRDLASQWKVGLSWHTCSCIHTKDKRTENREEEEEEKTVKML